MLYTIKPGDTIPDLARRFNLSEAQIKQAAKVTDEGSLPAGLLIRLSDAVQLSSSAGATPLDPTAPDQLSATVAKAQTAGAQAAGAQTAGAQTAEAPSLPPQPTVARWSEAYDVPGVTGFGPDLDVPDYGSVYQPGSTLDPALAAPKKSGWDQLIDGAYAKMDETAQKIETATGNNPLVKLFTGWGRFQVQVAGGALKAVGDMVGGIVNAVAHPIQTLKGLWSLAAHIPFSPPNLIHVGIQAAQGKNFSEILEEEKRYAVGVWNGLTAGYQTATKEGKWGEIPGRLLVDVGSMLIGAGEAGAAAKGVSNAAKGVSSAGKAASVIDDVAKVASVADDVAKASRLQQALSAATAAVKGSRVAGVATKAAVATQKVLDLLADVGKAALTAAKSNKLGSAAVTQAQQLGTKVLAIADKAKSLQGVQKASELYAKLADEALIVAREARALGATVKDASYAQIALELETRAGQMRLAATAASTGIPLNALDGGVSAFGDR